MNILAVLMWLWCVCTSASACVCSVHYARVYDRLFCMGNNNKRFWYELLIVAYL